MALLLHLQLRRYRASRLPGPSPLSVHQYKLYRGTRRQCHLLRHQIYAPMLAASGRTSIRHHRSRRLLHPKTSLRLYLYQWRRMIAPGSLRTTMKTRKRCLDGTPARTTTQASIRPSAIQVLWQGRKRKQCQRVLRLHSVSRRSRVSGDSQQRPRMLSRRQPE